MEPITENVFAAECIRKSRNRKNKIEYLIKWKGWSSKWDSWEPAENILDNRLIQDFDKRQERAFQKKNSPKKPKTNKTTEKRKSNVVSKSASAASSKKSPAKPAAPNTVAPLVIKIHSAGLENEEDQSSSDDNASSSATSSVSASSSVSSPNAPPKLSPQGPLSSDGLGTPGPLAAVWETEPAPPPEKRSKVKRIECTEEFKFTNRTLTDVRVNETTVTFVEL